MEMEMKMKKIHKSVGCDSDTTCMCIVCARVLVCLFKNCAFPFSFSRISIIAHVYIKQERNWESTLILCTKWVCLSTTIVHTHINTNTTRCRTNTPSFRRNVQCVEYFHSDNSRLAQSGNKRTKNKNCRSQNERNESQTDESK